MTRASAPNRPALALFNPVYDNGPDGYGYSRVKDYWKKISPAHLLTEDVPANDRLPGHQR